MRDTEEEQRERGSRGERDLRSLKEEGGRGKGREGEVMKK